VGRRLAQLCIDAQPEEAATLGVHPEVVEAACLAHDLGHPPFGHAGEHILHELVEPEDREGFEGNAQSFRVLAKLAVRFDECEGLDLTRATLAATLKYPWHRDPTEPGRDKKWSAYRNEEADFRFARELFQGESKTAEAELMDWADDIAYSVHDLEDFHRCGTLPWHRILQSENEIVNNAVVRWYGGPTNAEGRLREAFRNLKALLEGSFAQLIEEPYEGTREQRQMLRLLTSGLIGRYIRAVTLVVPSAEGDSVVRIKDDEGDEVRILKQITWDYIINNPSLAAQQKGQEHILRTLYTNVFEDSQKAPAKYLPIRLQSLWAPEATNAARFVADCLSSLTENEAMGLHARLHGISGGSVLDPIVR